MALRKKVLKINDGTTLLEGFDVGKYPLHDFIIPVGIQIPTGWPLRILSTGNDEWTAGCWRRRENSQICSLELVIGGVFKFKQDGQVYHVHAGEMFIVRPGTDGEMSLAEGRFAKKRVVEITGTLLPALLNLTGLDQCNVIRTLNEPWLQEQYTRCYELCSEPKADFMRESSAIVYEMLLELGRSASQADYPQDLLNILTYMEQNICHSLTISHLCQNFHISQATLHRLFRKHLNDSPIGHFIRLKMETACNLLTASHYSIKEIAQQLGYSNQLYFSSEFKKRMNVSPREYRMNPNQR